MKVPHLFSVASGVVLWTVLFAVVNIDICFFASRVAKRKPKCAWCLEEDSFACSRNRKIKLWFVVVTTSFLHPGRMRRAKGGSRRHAFGLRTKHRADNIRCTLVSPGAVATELPESSSEEATRNDLREFYKMAVPADPIARAISYAIEQPVDVEIGEIVIRPTAQHF
jgi:hypothetical protein